MSTPEQEWWVFDNGANTLKGVHGDATNPPVLSDYQIYDFLRNIPAARESFNRLYPLMTPDEKARLDNITDAARFLAPDIKASHDTFQAKQNTDGIFTTGPRGGGF